MRADGTHLGARVYLAVHDADAWTAMALVRTALLQAVKGLCTIARERRQSAAYYPLCAIVRIRITGIRISKIPISIISDGRARLITSCAPCDRVVRARYRVQQGIAPRASRLARYPARHGMPAACYPARRDIRPDDEDRTLWVHGLGGLYAPLRRVPTGVAWAAGRRHSQHANKLRRDPPVQHVACSMQPPATFPARARAPQG